MKRIIWFVVVLCMQMSFAASPSDTGSSCGQLIYSPTLALGIAALLVITLLTLAYMLSRLTESREITAKLNVEVATFISSVLVTVIIVVTLYAICAFTVENVTGGTSLYDYVIRNLTSIQQSALSKSQELTRQALSHEYESVYYGFFATPFTPAGGAGKSYRAYHLAISTYQNIIIDLLLVQYITAKTFEVVFVFMQNIGLTALLGLGVTLRILPFFRELGSYILAFVFAFGVILPFIFALNLSFAPTSVPDYTDPFADSMTHVAYIIAQMLFFPNVAIAVAATAFLVVGRAIDSFSVNV